MLFCSFMCHRPALHRRSRWAKWALGDSRHDEYQTNVRQSLHPMRRHIAKRKNKQKYSSLWPASYTAVTGERVQWSIVQVFSLLSLLKHSCSCFNVLLCADAHEMLSLSLSHRRNTSLVYSLFTLSWESFKKARSLSLSLSLSLSRSLCTVALNYWPQELNPL